MSKTKRLYILSLLLLMIICSNILKSYASPTDVFSSKAKNEMSNIPDNSSYKLVIKKSVEEYYDEFTKVKTVIKDVDANSWKEFETVKFGKYEIDGNLNNGYEDIEWFVLETSGKEVTLFSKYVLCVFKYNSDFFDKAFNEIEKKLLLTKERNKVRFMISKDEIKKYFNKDGKDLSKLISTDMTPYLLNQELVDYYGDTPLNVKADMKYAMANVHYARPSQRSSKTNLYRNCCTLNGFYDRVTVDRGKKQVRDYGFLESSLYKTNSVGLRPFLKIDFSLVSK